MSVFDRLGIKDTKYKVKKHKLSSDFYRTLNVDVLKETEQADCKDRRDG